MSNPEINAGISVSNSLPAYQASLKTSSNAKIICLLSSPRSLSTAFLMSIQARGDMQIMHELGVYAYLSSSIQQQRNSISRPETVDALPTQLPTYPSVINCIQSEAKKSETIFIKEMIYAAKHYVINPIFDDSYFFFLLRAPEESIISNYKKYSKPIDPLIKDIMNYKQTLDLCNHMKQLGRRVFFIKTQELNDNPHACMKQFCDLAEIQFIEESLQWKPVEEGVIKISEYFYIIPEWHGTAVTSSGFNSKHLSSIHRGPDGKPTFQEIPVEHRQGYIDFYQEQISYYNELLQMTLQKPHSVKAKL